MSRNILIAGGSGKIGRSLTAHFQSNNYTVSWLSSSNKTSSRVNSYNWDYKTGSFDEKALDGVNAIINLAGEGIANKKWSKDRKKILRDSRIKSTELLLRKVEETQTKLSAFISASAIGYYGYDSGSIEKKEGSRFGDDFLATLTKDWEAAAAGFNTIGVRTVMLRTGIVIGKDQSAWQKISGIIRTGFGAAVGSGDQFMSWIHIDDLCRMYQWALENENCKGVYNAVAPNPVTNKEFTREAGRALKKPIFMPNVPGFILKLIYGEVSSALLGSSRVSAEKITQEGFTFSKPTLESALQEI